MIATPETLTYNALCGGSNYWIKDIHIPDDDDEDEWFTTRFFRKLEEGGTVVITTICDSVHELVFDDLVKANKLLHDNHPRHYASLITEEDDKITADVWFQLAVFNEIIYVG
ncbi:MAG: hypothetical protein JSV53_12095 [candidate division WOR-3 bacterium]|jgi:hypothetical protein|nr:MAG: hypothetical protein JSV53_12095 [candidate division WOR-3 bacterium]